MDRGLYCSSLSQKRSEQIFGTAPLVERWILIEDRGIWNEPALPDRNLPDYVIEWLHHAASSQERSRPLLIRQGHRASGPLRCFVGDTRETGSRLRRIQFKSYGELVRVDLETAGEIVHEPMFLVCTHGRHDKCCSRFGLPAYRALRRVFESITWECSHVGGDRFAANLVCLPHGLYYGHLLPEQAVAVARAYSSGALPLGQYRGRSCYPRLAQIGEFFVRSSHGLVGLEELILRNIEQLSSDQWRVHFDSRHSDGLRFTAGFEEDKIAQSGLLTCGAIAPKTIRQYRPVFT